MTSLRIAKSQGNDAILEDAVVEDFATQLRGPLLRASDIGYDTARIVWNGMIDRRPALIARCAGSPSMMAAVHFLALARFWCRSRAAATTLHRQCGLRRWPDD